MHDPQGKRLNWLICLGLALSILAAYAPLWGCGFVAYDDPVYVTANDRVQHGLNWRSLAWAFTTGRSGNWHPLTWISHMVDFQLYGLHPAGHHATSLALHIANTILLFLVFQRLTGSRWAAALVAALFGLHPLHVESVAWVAERKDVLSTFFWMLTVLAYTKYVQEEKTQSPGRRRFYLWALFFYGLGLMAKSMLVTLPCLLMLLDFWPLRRVEFGRWRWREKVPFFALAAAVSVVTFLVQEKTGAVASLANTSLAERLAAIPVSYLRYVGKTLWPWSLALLYPYPEHPRLLPTFAAAALLALVTVWVWRKMASQPWLLVGWLWFLGSLVPVIGLVQVGAQAMADRYSYIPVVGLFLMAVWEGRDWQRKHPGPLGGGLSAAVLAGCLVLTSRQVWYWQTTRELFTHAIKVSPNNYMASVLVGDDYATAGENEKAADYFRAALSIAPNYPLALNGLGKIYFSQGKFDQALAVLEPGIRVDPKNPALHYSLGFVLLAKGRIPDALDQFQQQVDLDPDDYLAQSNFADILLRQGLTDDAIPHFQKAIDIRPDEAGPRAKLGAILLQKHRAAEAAAQFEQALRIRPDNLAACRHLAWVLATSPLQALRDGPRAVELARRAQKMSVEENPQDLGVLAAALAEDGRFAEAAATAAHARQLALAQANSAVADVLGQQIKLYQAGSPYRDTPGPDPGTP